MKEHTRERDIQLFSYIAEHPDVSTKEICKMFNLSEIRIHQIVDPVGGLVELRGGDMRGRKPLSDDKKLSCRVDVSFTKSDFEKIKRIAGKGVSEWVRQHILKVINQLEVAPDNPSNN